MECIEILKNYEQAWKRGFITTAEYIGLLDYGLRVLSFQVYGH